MKHYELEISQFADNELPAGEQKELFAHLIDCEECRGTLSDFMGMKKEARAFYENIDVELNPAIALPANAERGKEKKVYKPLFYFAAAASIVLGLLFLLKQSDINRLESRYDSLKAKYNEVVFAGENLPQKEYIHEAAKKENSLNVKKGMHESKPTALKNYHSVKQNKKNTGKVSAVNLAVVQKNESQYQLQKSRQIQVVQVTKNDFLTPQIIGN